MPYITLLYKVQVIPSPMGLGVEVTVYQENQIYIAVYKCRTLTCLKTVEILEWAMQNNLWVYLYCAPTDLKHLAQAMPAPTQQWPGTVDSV